MEARYMGDRLVLEKNPCTALEIIIAGSIGFTLALTEKV
jgi:hypothetical protein